MYKNSSYDHTIQRIHIYIYMYVYYTYYVDIVCWNDSRVGRACNKAQLASNSPSLHSLRLSISFEFWTFLQLSNLSLSMSKKHPEVRIL